MTMTPRLKEMYLKNVVPSMMKEFGYKNQMEVPKIKRVVLNMGMGKAGGDAKVIELGVTEMGKIAGQKPVVTKAKKAIANFKLRQGMPVGCMVTLRKANMYEFMDRFFNVALPRVRDFKGVPTKGFDEKGNYTMGIREHIIFPEIDFDKVDKLMGFNVTFVTSAKTKEEARSLLSLMGMPFRKN